MIQPPCNWLFVAVLAVDVVAVDVLTVTAETFVLNLKSGGVYTDQKVLSPPPPCAMCLFGNFYFFSLNFLPFFQL